MKRTLLFLFAGPGIALWSQAQVNAYAEVTAVAGTNLTLANATEVFDTFEDGEQAIIMQMQDDVIGPYLSNLSSFGSLNAISSAGFWEIVTIVSHTEALGLPVSAVVSAPLVHAFHFGAKHRVQLISFPQLGTPDFTTTAPINAVSWNGVVGGVVALQVTRKLNLAHDIRADNCGFRGGTPSANFYFAACNTTTYTTSSNTYGAKGEGIQRFSSTAYQYARGRWANGGGGGNPRNAGGGGGSNFTTGGYGGGGYGCASGGVPGKELDNYVFWDRFFMGGGGGGGHANNSIGGAGGHGGGIVILRADTLATSGMCAMLFISANGGHGGSSVGPVPDGAGGGGAGGSVFLNVNTVATSPTRAVTCQANGGNGGAVSNTTPAPNNWIDTGGGGGGGGQGLVMCSGMASGISAGTSSGAGGVHQPNGARASNGTGANDAGVFGFGGAGGLPVELVYFIAKPEAHYVRLDWTTATEQNNAFFRVWRSPDGIDWHALAEQPGAGDSQQLLAYSAVDDAPLPGTSYYRLEQVDLNGDNAWSDVVSVDRGRPSGLTAYPVPADGTVFMEVPFVGAASVAVMDGTGREVTVGTVADGRGQLLVGQLPAGTYFLVLTAPNGTMERSSIVVQH